MCVSRSLRRRTLSRVWGSGKTLHVEKRKRHFETVSCHASRGAWQRVTGLNPGFSGGQSGRNRRSGRGQHGNLAQVAVWEL